MFSHPQYSVERKAVRAVRIAWVRLWAGRARKVEHFWAVLYAVRRNWPDGGHDFFALSGSESETALRAASLPAYWRRSSFRPTQSVVRISRHDFGLHRRRNRGRVRCLEPDCPVPTERWQSLVEGTVWR